MVLSSVSGNFPVEKELGQEICASLNFYDKPSKLKNKLKIIDMNYVMDDNINTDDEFVKNEDYTKRDKIKNAFLLELLTFTL